DDEIVEAVAVEVAEGELVGEAVARLGEATEQEVVEHDRAGQRQPARAAEQQMQRAGRGVLSRHSDRQLVEAVAVPVAGGEREAEAVAGLRGAGELDLAEAEGAGRIRPGGRAGNRDHPSRGCLTLERLSRSRDREVV